MENSNSKITKFTTTILVILICLLTTIVLGSYFLQGHSRSLPIALAADSVPTSVGYNKYDLFQQYMGIGKNGKYAKFWRTQIGGSVGSEVTRYGPILNNAKDGYHFLRMSNQVGSSSPLVVQSDQFLLSPITDYILSAFFRKSNNTGNFKIVTLDAAGTVLQENNLALLSSGFDSQGQNWSDGWTFVNRQFSFTTPMNAVSGYIEIALNGSPTATMLMDVDQTSLTTLGSTNNILPNPSFEYADTTEAISIARQLLDEARGNNIAYMRINGGLFCSYDYNFWQQDPQTYWSVFDQMVQDANARNIKLIPVIMWQKYAFPSLAGESFANFFNLNSASNRLLRQYTSELVTRYKDNPTILFWELTNELNLSADLDLDGRGIHDPCLGTWEPAGSKNFTTDQMVAFMRDFAQYIRGLDPSHSISSGYSAPRLAAQHLRMKPEWTGADWTQDTFEQMQTWLYDTHPDPIDIISVHLYPNSGTNTSVTDIQRANSSFGKKVFIGEFGDYNTDGTWKTDPQFAQGVLDDIVKYRIPYSAPWTWQWITSAHPKTYHNNSFAPDFAPQVITMVNNANTALFSVPPPDVIAPLVTITSPANNASTFEALTITATATDNFLITKTEFYIDNSLIGTDTTYTYSVTINSQDYSNGTHTLSARSYDSSSNIGTSTTVSVKFIDITVPSVSVTAPLNNTYVSQGTKVAIQTDTSDISGISKVEFFVNSKLICTDTTAPYSCAWNVPRNKKIIYTLQAKAYDVANNAATSSAVTVISK